MELIYLHTTDLIYDTKTNVDFQGRSDMCSLLQPFFLIQLSPTEIGRTRRPIGWSNLPHTAVQFLEESCTVLVCNYDVCSR